MLADISNRLSAETPTTAERTNNSKHALVAPTTAREQARTHGQWAMNHNLADTTASSSSSPGHTAQSSSPYFARTRLDTFDLPTSPGASSVVDKLATSPLRRTLASLPPSSPTFACPAPTALDELVNASALASRASSPCAAVRDANSATPKRDPGLDTPRTLHLERGTVLYFGRKARKAIPRRTHAHGSPTEEETHVPVILPKSAKNASRIHCSIRIIDATADGHLVTEVRVTGQNGMKVDGKVRRNGSVIRTEKRAGETLRVSFWGWSAKVVIADSEVGLVSDEESEQAYATAREKHEHDDHAEGSSESEQRPTKSRRRASSPAHSFHSDDHGLSPEPEHSALPPLSSPRASSLAPGPSPAALRAAALASSLGLDLPGLIASAIVFHSRSTVAASEVIHGLLGETRSMWTILTSNEEELERIRDSPAGEARAIEAWQDLVEDVLAREDMFGMIDNSGLKDASGRPLPPYYFYIPDQDPSLDRVAALEPFVKRVRGARTKKQARYFWAKPSLKRNR
ncbi:hypothetical protein JCM10908_003122 [Rhodotorula pacifica]|uniref:uncharacterized protein n=1 Tax=Rhodotorula pacifica TaxID=1495444 RepID=UPI00318076E5